MGEYNKPSKDYDFKSHSDYQLLVSNIDFEDPLLLRLIKETHEDIDITINSNRVCNNNIEIPIFKNDVKLNISKEIESITFNDIEDVILFIKSSSLSNYFFIYSYKNLVLEYCLLDLTHVVRGSLYEYKLSKIRDYKLNRLNIN